MTILSLNDFSVKPSLPAGCICALGFFDGVHIGHRAITDTAVHESEKCGTCPVVWMISRSDDTFKGNPSLLSTEEEKLRLLADAGIRYAVLSPFEDIRNMSGEAFVREVLCDTLALSGVVCGFNFRFGKGAASGTDELDLYCKDCGISCRIVPPVTSDGISVSSSRIRRLITDGNVAEAAHLLGRPYSFTLPVVHGKMLGRTLGFPTVNQLIPPMWACPARGVYAAAVTITEGDKVSVYPGAANIGVCPTVTDEILTEAGLTKRAPGAADTDHPVCETYISGFSGDLYGKNIKISFLERIRGEVKFCDTDKLSEQIRHDAECAELIFNGFYSKNSTYKK